MKKYIGVDLGTSSIKLLLVSQDGHIEKTASEEYPISFPQPGWSEQDPELWWSSFKKALAELIKDTDVSKIAALGVAGQMHGLVALDKDD
ncbi:MAG: xylulokinase, partial [Spirochaetales bacterium]|nr:xylulokinase [Spirochaetales bacterium]